MRVISISALAPRCGKDALTNSAMMHLAQTHRKSSAQVAFGGALKFETAAAMFPRSSNMQSMIRGLFITNKDTPRHDMAIKYLCMSNYKLFLMKSGHDIMTPRSPRWHLQQYGTEFVRVYQNKPLYWIEQVEDKLSYLQEKDFVFITDTRFPLEFMLGRDKLKAYMVHINPIGFPSDHWGPLGIHQHLGNKNESALADYTYDLQLNNVYGLAEASAHYLVANILKGY